MYRIDKQPYGFRLTFGGFIQKDEMAKWVADSEKALVNVSGAFGVLVDMRTLKPLPSDAQAEMKIGQVMYKTKGMQRSAVILSDTLTTMQFRRIGKETGIDKWERYIDASTNADWAEQGETWLTLGKEP
jgi:hypothetical protein